MALDPNIILAGQTPDILGAIDRGRQAAESQIGLNRQNALANLYREQGAGIAAGDQNAINMLAQFDPLTALDAQNSVLSGQHTRQQMTALDAETKRRAADYAKTISAEQAAAEAAEIEAAIKQALAAPTPQAFDALMVQMGREDMVGQFDQRQTLALPLMEYADILKAIAPPEAPKPADDYQRYVQEETAAGRQPLDRIGFANALKGKGVSMTTTNADGSVTTVQLGGSAAGTGEATVGEAYNPNEISSVINMIDEIAVNPNLDRVVGPIEGGGGNNIDDLGTIARGYYGGEGTALIERIGQLQNNAWLSARQMLKGGGAITDYESRKAEGAVARLSRAKSEAEFRTALKDLRDAIVEGEAKLRGVAVPTPAPAATPAPATGAVPEGIDPADWEHLTPEERALFQ